MDREITETARWRGRGARIAKPLAFVVAVALAAAWTAGSLRPGVRIDDLRFSTVKRGDLEASFSALGTVEPASERVMTSPVNGRLLRVLRRPGSVVEQGETLLVLDTSATRLELSQVDGRLEQARSGREERRLGLEKEAADLQSRLSIARLELEEATFRLEQSQTLHDEGLISVSTLRTSETRMRRLELEILGLETAVDKAAAAAAAQLAGLDASIGSLGREKAEIERVLESATGRAERSGVVTWILEDEGRSVLEGDELVRLADLESFHIEASVSDVHSQRLEVGLTVRVPIGEEQLEGRVSRVLPAVDDGALRFTVELERPGHPGLRPSLRLDVSVITDLRLDVLMLERSAVAAGGRSRDVFVLAPSGDRAVRRRAEFGVTGGRHFEITAGLDEGERVVLNDLSRFSAVETLRLR